MNTRPAFLCAALLAFGMLPSCTKDGDDEVYAPASIVFRTDAGYTFTNDTLDAGDTVHLGVIINEGSEPLRTFYAHFADNGGPAQLFDSLPMSAFPFVYDTSIVLNDTPGSEKWTFTAQEENGDRTQRILTLVTQ